MIWFSLVEMRPFGGALHKEDLQIISEMQAFAKLFVE